MFLVFAKATLDPGTSLIPHTTSHIAHRTYRIRIRTPALQCVAHSSATRPLVVGTMGLGTMGTSQTV
jgi:hypothetical protein